jgi:hypothetical protein
MKNWRILKFILYKMVPMALWLVKFHEAPHIAARRLGSVAGPVIQATGRLEFEDGLGSGDFVSGYSYHMSVRTRLSDHTKQTKFQSQRPYDVETPVPSILSTEVQQHRDSQYLDGWPPWVISPFKENADCSCCPPVVSTSWGNDINVYILRNDDSAINCIRNTG